MNLEKIFPELFHHNTNDITIYNSKNKIYCEGDPAYCCYIIMEGEIALYRKSKNGKNVLIGRVVPGECIGLIGLIEINHQYLNTAIAYTDVVKVIKINYESFNTAVERLDIVNQAVIGLMIKRLNNSYKRIYRFL